MMHLLHRTIPFIAIAALVTATPAGAQAREDSTSNAGSVMSLLGLGGNFVGFGSTGDDVSPPNAWNCGGGCRASGARQSRNAPFGEFVSSLRSSKGSDAESKGRSRHSQSEHADLSDYGWSRRVGSDGAALGPARPDATVDNGQIGSSAIGSAKGILAPASPDGVGQAPSWIAPGSNSEAAPAARGDGFGELNAGPTAASASRTVAQSPMFFANQQFSALAVSMDNVAPIVTTAPEPGTVVLLAFGMSTLLVLRTRRARRQ